MWNSYGRHAPIRADILGDTLQSANHHCGNAYPLQLFANRCTATSSRASCGCQKYSHLLLEAFAYVFGNFPSEADGIIHTGRIAGGCIK